MFSIPIPFHPLLHIAPAGDYNRQIKEMERTRKRVSGLSHRRRIAMKHTHTHTHKPAAVLVDDDGCDEGTNQTKTHKYISSPLSKGVSPLPLRPPQSLNSRLENTINNKTASRQHRNKHNKMQNVLHKSVHPSIHPSKLFTQLVFFLCLAFLLHFSQGWVFCCWPAFAFVCLSHSGT